MSEQAMMCSDDESGPTLLAIAATGASEAEAEEAGRSFQIAVEQLAGGVVIMSCDKCKVTRVLAFGVENVTGVWAIAFNSLEALNTWQATQQARTFLDGKLKFQHPICFYPSRGN